MYSAYNLNKQDDNIQPWCTPFPIWNQYLTSPSWGRSVLGVHLKNWCWSWNSNTLATWGKELTHWKRPWCWERLGAGGEGDDRGWDGWMASPTQWTWVWVNSRSWWWTGRPGMLRFMVSQRVRHDWATELNCSMSGSNCYFLTCIQISQEAGQVVRYSHFLKNFPRFDVIHTINGSRCFSGTLAFSMTQRVWQFDLWFLCLFLIHRWCEIQ